MTVLCYYMSMLIALIAITLSLAYQLSLNLVAIALTYFLVNFAYSNWLKHILLVNVLILASGFVLRVAAGVTVIHVQRFSPWLYVVTTLLALFIGFGKRRAELCLLGDKADSTRRVLAGYNMALLVDHHLITIVSASTILTYSLYSFSAPNLPKNDIMMLTIPFVLYGVFHYLHLIHVKHEGGASEELILTDRPLQINLF